MIIELDKNDKNIRINSQFLTKSEFIKMENKVKSLRAGFIRIRNGLEIK